MAQQRPVVIPDLTFPVDVPQQNIAPIPQGDYNTAARDIYPAGVRAVTRRQAPDELRAACARIRDLQWVIDHKPEAGSPNTPLGRTLRAKHAVLRDRANYCLRIM